MNWDPSRGPTWSDISLADVCPACNALRCLPTCRRYVEPAPLADSIEGIRELQRAIGEAS